MTNEKRLLHSSFGLRHSTFPLLVIGHWDLVILALYKCRSH
jgi:hypothetical protein